MCQTTGHPRGEEGIDGENNTRSAARVAGGMSGAHTGICIWTVGSAASLSVTRGISRAVLALAGAAVSYTDDVAQYFQSRPGVWVNGMHLAAVGGCYAWRSRVSDCRRLGMHIDNRQWSAQDGQTVSEYRFRLTPEAAVEE